MKNLILSNPLVDVETERMNQHHLGHALGLYDQSQSPQVETLRKKCEQTINDPNTPVALSSDNCKSILDYITDTTGEVN